MRIKVKPVLAGAVIRDPHTRQPLPNEGAEVEDSNFWRRRIIAGDVVLMGIEEAAPPPSKEKPSKRSE